MLKLNKKASMTISISIFVVAIFILSSAVLVKFILLTRDDAHRIFTTEVIDSTYAKEDQLNYFLENLIENIEIDPQSLEIDYGFREQLRTDLLSYKDEIGRYPIPELSQVEEQLENALIIPYPLDQAITVNFDIVLHDFLIFEKDEIYFISYSYNKVFIKDFSQDL